MPRTRVLGLATSLPQNAAGQASAELFATRVLEHAAPTPQRDRALGLVPRIYSQSGIDTRYSALRDYRVDDPLQFEFYPSNWELDPFPSTTDRMRVYEKVSVELAEEAALRSLVEAGVSAGEVTHLIVCTCTGFFAPGPDVLLIERLELRRDVKRTIIGFMGCYAGFNGMRTADQIIGADPEAVVLHVCVELCSLHFQKRAVADFLVANCLFADGCAAVVYGDSVERGRSAGGLLELGASSCRVDGGSLDHMTWHIGDTGFEMRLSTRVPASLGAVAPSFVRSLLALSGLDRDCVGSWAVHPGGWRIVEALARALGLSDTNIASSLDVLRMYGNMSSATIFFVIDRLLRGGEVQWPMVALGFGPGLTIEGAVLLPCD